MKLSFLRALLVALICTFSLPVFADKVDINTATAEQLAANLKGIGPSKAQAIVAYRNSNGLFTTVEQLVEVKGIGQATLDKNRERLSTGEKPNAKADANAQNKIADK